MVESAAPRTTLGFLSLQPAAVGFIAECRSQGLLDIAGAASLSSDSRPLVHSAGLREIGERWDSLFAAGVTAFVLCGSSSDLCDESRQAVSAGIDLLVFPDADMGDTWAYEISIAAEEQRSRALPLWLHRFDPILPTIGLLLPNVRQIEIALSIATQSGQLTIRDADLALLPLLDLIRWLFGPYDRITALPSGSDQNQLYGLNIVLSATGRPDISLAIKPGPQSVTQMTLIAPTDRHEYVCSENGQWQAIGNAAASSNDDRLQRLCQDLAKTLQAPPRGEWSSLVQAFEMLDGIHRSMVRRRPIELYFERISERAQFKTQMATLGCFVLLATPFLMLAYLGIANVVPLSPTALLLLRAAVFAPLFLFLAGQALYTLTRDERHESPRTTATESQPTESQPSESTSAG